MLPFLLSFSFCRLAGETLPPKRALDGYLENANWKHLLNRSDKHSFVCVAGLSNLCTEGELAPCLQTGCRGRQRRAWDFSYLIFHALAQSGWAIFGKDACSFIVCTCVQFLKNNRGSGSSYGSWRKGGGLLSCFLPGMISAVWVYWCGEVWPVQQHGFWLCLRVLNRRSPNPSCSQSLMSPAYSFHKP